LADILKPRSPEGEFGFSAGRPTVPDDNRVFLDPTSWPLWLGEEPGKPDELKAMLVPYPSAGMTCWPVSKRVGNVKNNEPSLIEPIASADA
jgi:putative SOS response-associated peptidase YedK